MLQKVAVVGAGNVGATAAQRIAEKNLARTVVMVDVVEGVPAGQGARPVAVRPDRGLRHARHRHQRLRRGRRAPTSFVITAGIARKPGMTRDDLVNTNAGIVKSVGEQIKRVAPNAIVIVVSNPLDVMCYVAMQATGFPRERVIGMAGVLDTARYRTFLAEAIDVSVQDIQAMVLGGHGDTMVPLRRYTTVSGIPVTQLIEPGQARRDRRPGAQRRRRDRDASSRPGRRTTRRVRRPCRWSRRSCTTRSGSCRARPGSRASTACRDVFCGVPVQARAGGAGADRRDQALGRGARGARARRPRRCAAP